MIEITAEQSDRISAILSGLGSGVMKQVTSSVIRRGLQTARSESTKSARQTYNISYKTIKDNSKLSVKTIKSNLEVTGMLSFSGNLIPLINFKAKDTKINGVNVNVSKEDGTLSFEDAYIANLGKYGVGVFQRETNKRNSSRQLYGPSVSHMVDNNEVRGNIEEKTQETINKRIEHEISRILNRY